MNLLSLNVCYAYDNQGQYAELYMNFVITITEDDFEYYLRMKAKRNK